MKLAASAAIDPSKRGTKGYDPSKVPNPDAFTVLNLLQILEKDSSARLLLDHSSFQYNRIS